MYLSKLLILNYKSCKLVDLEFEKDLPNIMVGINDSGKTTILRAIGLLLGDKFAFNFMDSESYHSDISNTILKKTEFINIFKKYSLPQLEYNTRKAVILAQFKIETDEINEDEISISNQLLWCLENSNDEFWICKEYNENDCDEKLYILIDDSREENIELWNLSITNLKKKLTEYDVSKEDIENKNKVGRFKSIEIIRAIYEKTTLSKFWKDYTKSFKIDKIILPKYRYLDWNLNLNDLTELVSDTMASVVEKYKRDALILINQYSEKAENEINEELKKFKKDLFEDIPNIEAIEARFKLNLSEDLRDILIKKTDSDKLIHVDSQGEGVKRRIWFAFIKWNALKPIDSADSYKRYIWCFDEPETHLYPASQREFFNMIKKLSTSNLQTVISTHSTIFTDKSKFETIKSINLDEKYTVVSKCDTPSDIFESLQLRNSDFLFYDKFLAVEGDTEEILIPYLYKLYTGKSLNEDSIQLIKLNSKSKKTDNQRILEQIMKDFKKPENCLVFILDKDSQYDNRNLINNPNVKMVGIQDIEDSINNQTWINLVNEELQLPEFINDEDIRGVKSSIPQGVKARKEDKFYKKLQILIRRKKESIDGESINYDLLPDKGKASGEMIVKYITNIAQIDPKIKEAFDLIKP